MGDVLPSSSVVVTPYIERSHRVAMVGVLYAFLSPLET